MPNTSPSANSWPVALTRRGRGPRDRLIFLTLSVVLAVGGCEVPQFMGPDEPLRSPSGNGTGH